MLLKIGLMYTHTHTHNYNIYLYNFAFLKYDPNLSMTLHEIHHFWGDCEFGGCLNNDLNAVFQVF